MAACHQGLNRDFTLAELVNTDFVRCEFCNTIFTAPLLLPCLHTFCEKCIAEVIIRENVDKLKEIKYEKSELRGKKGQSKPGDSSTNNNNANGHSGDNGHGLYTFNCPTCKSVITIENNGLLETITSSTEQEDYIDDNDKITSNGSIVKDNESTALTLIQSLSISLKTYKSITRAIKSSLPSNHFIESVTHLYRYRNEVGRECAYCKTEAIVEEAKCLCLQCNDDVCEGCAAAHRKTRITRNHSVVPYTAIQQGLFDHDIRKASGIKCQDHPELDVTHFCNDCLKVVCKKCSSKHHNHNIQQLTDAASKLSLDIKNVQEGLSRRIPDLSKYVQFLSEQLKSLQNRHTQATDEINIQVELIHQMIDDWKANILSDLDRAVNQEHKIIEEKINNFNMTKNSTEKAASLLLHLFNLGKADEKMGSYASIMRRYQQLIRTKPKALATRLGISFTQGPTTGQNIQILIGQLGLKQEAFDSDDSPKSRLPISSLMPATLEIPVLIKSWTIPSSKPNNNSDANQQSTEDSSCYISGIAMKGNMLAAVDRKNAKVIIQDYNSQRVLKEFTGSGAHKLRKPFDIVFLPSGALAITDPEASAVRVFDWTGKFLFTFDAEIQQRGRKDKDQEEEESGRKESMAVRHPRGITITKKGEVVVLDGHFRHCTVHDSNTGKILRTIYPYKDSTRRCKHPSNNHSESHPNKNNKMDDGSISKAVQKSRPETEQLDVILVDPFYICTTPDDNLVITDAASPNVKILGWPSGLLLQESLDYGIRKEECLHPTGVCVDHKSGYMLLVDTNNNRIHLGLPDGHFSTILIPSTTPTSAVGDTGTNSADSAIETTSNLSHPTCLCLDQDGHLVVGQVGGKINVYKYL